MPRQGITREAIRTAIEALQARGEKVTKNTVRAELGNTGSFGTIVAEIRAWADEQPQMPQEAAAPVPIPEVVMGLYVRAWGASVAAAQAEVAGEREAMQAAVAAAKAEQERQAQEDEEAIRVLEAQAAARDEQLDALQAQLRDNQAQLLGATERAGSLAAKLEAAEAKIVTMKAQIEGLTAELEKKAHPKK